MSKDKKTKAPVSASPLAVVMTPEELREEVVGLLRHQMGTNMALHLALNQDSTRIGRFDLEKAQIGQRIEEAHASLAAIAEHLFGHEECGVVLAEIAKRCNEVFVGSGVQVGLSDPEGNRVDVGEETGIRRAVDGELYHESGVRMPKSGLSRKEIEELFAADTSKPDDDEVGS